MGKQSRTGDEGGNTMRHCVREFESEDVAQVSDISRSYYTGKRGSFSLVESIGRPSMIAKYVVADSRVNAIYGYALLAEQISPNVKLRLELFARKPFAKERPIHELYGRAERIAMQLAPYAVEARVFPENEWEIDFYAKKGFAENHRMDKRMLYVPEANLAPFLQLDERLESKGIAVRTLAEERARQPTCFERLEKLVLETNPDFPDELPPHLRRPNRDVSWLQGPGIVPEAFFIAVHQGSYVGYSHLSEGSDRSCLQQGFTAVRREFRNLGIATALKIRGIRFAQANGIDFIYTSNRASNGPMARVNERLGWIVYDSELRLEKVLNPERSP